ncbi:Protein MNN4 [Yarrowia sp. C11]|nr:Protein MNN4 [Yarrowia sp. E02]KAG5367750.1 Protein MNN4 [Yarrowia sp. C11]
MLLHPLRLLRTSLLSKLFVILITCLIFGSLLNLTDSLPEGVKSRVAYMTDVGLVSSPRRHGAAKNGTGSISSILYTKIKFDENEKEFNPKWAQKKALDSSSDYSFQWKDWVDLTEVTGLFKAIQVGTCEKNKACLNQLHVTGPPTQIEPQGYFTRVGKVFLDQTMPKPKRLIYLTEKAEKKKRQFEKSRDVKSIMNESNQVREPKTESEPRDESASNSVADIAFSEVDPIHEDSYDDDDNGTILVPTGESEEELQEYADKDAAAKTYLRSGLRRDLKHLPLARELFTWNVDQEIDKGKPKKDAESEGPAREQIAHSQFLNQQWKHIKKSGKHFSEAWVVGDKKGAGVHYDWRFFTNFDTIDEKRVILRQLVRAWLDFTHREGIITWLAHGTLLGWYWNGQSLPWDFDGDVQMPIREFDRFARLYNQSLVVDESSGGRYYVDVGPTYVERLRGNGKNVIDARFIDVDSGMYIDITALAYAEQQEKFHCKNWHRYELDSVSPLRKTQFEGRVAYVPRDFEGILNQEYKKGPLTNTRFNGNLWNKYLRMWVKQDQCEMFQIEENVDERALRENGEPSTFGACYRPEYTERYLETKEMSLEHEREMEEIRNEQS